VGREPARADPAVRREGAAAIPARIDDVLAEARSRIRRYTPDEARADPDLLLVDTRSADERERDGVIEGAMHLPLSITPWRTDELAGRRVCLVCTHGYSSSLAAALLVALGVDAGDLIGGYEAW
jgi:rhodanese-related sulfurtransferase